jgi:hypothetical protein
VKWLDKLRSKWLVYQVETLHTKTWGRQPAGQQNAVMRARATISARVWRAKTCEWEDLGVVSQHDTTLTEKQVKKLRGG